MVKTAGIRRKDFRVRTAFVPAWKRFARARVLVKSGPKTKVTNAVRRFANSFPGNDLAAIERMGAAIAFFKIDCVNAVQKFGRQSAHETIASKTIPSFEVLVEGKHYGFTACTHKCDAFIAGLRAKGFRGVKFVAYKSIDNPHLHSIVLFKFKGKTFLADFYYLKIKPDIEEVSLSKLQLFEKLKKRGWLVDGKDSFDAGIKSIKDFWLGKKLDGFEVRERDETQEIADTIRKGIEREIGI